MSTIISSHSQVKRLLVIFLFVAPILACNFDSLMPTEPAVVSNTDVVSTQVSQTIAAQTTAVSTETPIDETPTVEIEPTEDNSPAETAVSLTSTTTANTHAQETRDAQELAIAQAAYVLPELRAVLDSVNVRNGPGTEYRVVSNLRINDTVPVIAKNHAGDWFVIELQGGSKGWVHDSVTDPVSAAAMAQIGIAATIPPSPTPIPTATYTPTPPPPTYTPTPYYTDGTLYANNVGYNDVCYLYISSSSSSDWGGDWLGSGILEAGGSYAITLESGWYDLRAEDCDGNEAYQYETYIPAGNYTNWDIYIESWSEETTLTVTNWLDETVCYLYISSSSSSEWGSDWLGSGVLEPYVSQTYYLSEGYYDVKAEDCYESELDVEWDIYVNGSSYWDIE